VTLTIARPAELDDADEMAAILTEYLSQAKAALIEAGAPQFDITHQIRYTMEDIPSYLPPKGAIFTARDADGALHGVAFQRMIRPDVAEIKRLYVRPSARGTGLGKALVHAVMDEARRLGAKRLFLDTVTTMSEAVALYRGLGFTDIEPFPEAQSPPEISAFAIYLAREL